MTARKKGIASARPATIMLHGRARKVHSIAHYHQVEVHEHGVAVKVSYWQHREAFRVCSSSSSYGTRYYKTEAAAWRYAAKLANELVQGRIDAGLPGPTPVDFI